MRAMLSTTDSSNLDSLDMLITFLKELHPIFCPNIFRYKLADIVISAPSPPACSNASTSMSASTVLADAYLSPMDDMETKQAKKGTRYTNPKDSPHVLLLLL